MTTVGDLYKFTDAKNHSWRIQVGAITLTDVEECGWDFKVGVIPTAYIKVPGRAPAAAVYRATVTIDTGFDGASLERQFTGIVQDVDPSEQGDTIRCVGHSWPLDVHYHEVVYTFNNVTSHDALEDLFEDSGIASYSVSVPGWTICAVNPVTHQWETYGEAITAIGEVDGCRWYELPTGTVRIHEQDPIPAATYWRTYFTGHLTDGYGMTWPTGTSEAGDGYPRIRKVGGQSRLRDCKNRARVKGCVLDTLMGDATTVPVDVTATAQATSPWVLMPGGAQAYNDLLFNSDLIDTDAKAADVAVRLVVVNNRLAMTVNVEIDGDPEERLCRTVRIVDPDYSGINSRWYVEGYSSRMNKSDFVTNLTLIGGPNAGSEVMLSPFAAFTYSVEREVIGDRVWGTVTFNGTASYDADGTIVSYSWSDTLGLVTGSDPIVNVRADPTGTTGWEVTLTVTDNDGLTNALTIPLNISPSENPDVFIPALFVAFGTYASASPDGGITWHDQALANCISTGAKGADGVNFGIGLFGTSIGTIYRTTDYCASAPTLVVDASVTGAQPIEYIWWDLNQPTVVWACTRNGLLLWSWDDGAHWALYDDLAALFGLVNIRTQRIGTPFGGGVWVFGGTGTGYPLIVFDPVVGSHAWAGVNLGVAASSELAADLAGGAGSAGPVGYLDGDGGVYSYSGGTWTEIHAQASSKYWRLKNLNGTLFRIRGSNSPSWCGDLERSGDGGVTWVQVVAAPGGTEGVNDVDRAADGTLWAAEVTAYGTAGRILKSVDDGLTWTSEYVLSPARMAMGISCHPTDPLKIAVIAGMTSLRLYWTTNGGASWNNSTNSPGGWWVGSPWTSQVRWLSTDRILVTGESHIVSYTDDYATTWHAPFSGGSNYIGSLVEGQPGELWMCWWDSGGAGEGHLAYSTDYGTSWDEDWALALADLGMHFSEVWGLAYDQVEQALYWASSFLAAAPAKEVMKYTHAGGWVDVTANIYAAGCRSDTKHYLCAPIAAGLPSDVYVADYADVGGYAAFILNSATHLPSVYGTDDVFGDGSHWRRATGAPAYSRGAWLAGDWENTKFVMGWSDDGSYSWQNYVGDVTAGVIAVSAAAASLDAHDLPNHGFWLGWYVNGKAGTYIIAAEATGTTAGTVYKTWDRFAHVGKIRPATGYTAPPAGAKAKMVAMGAPGTAPGNPQVYAQQSGMVTANYPRHVGRLDSATWTLVSDPVSANQTPVWCLKKLGGNLFRLACVDTTEYLNHVGQLQRSTDGGATWADVGPTPVGPFYTYYYWGVSSYCEDAGGTLWLCASRNAPDYNPAHTAYSPEIHKSVDGGATWTLSYTYGSDVYKCLRDICAHPSNQNVILAIGDTSPGILRTVYTTDRGANWTPVNCAGDCGQSVQGQRCVVMMANGRIVKGDWLGYSDNYGADWTASGGDGTSTYFRQILRVGDAIFVLHGGANESRILRSDDQGVTFLQVYDINAIWPQMLPPLSIIYSYLGNVLYAAGPSYYSYHKVIAISNPLSTPVGPVVDVSYNLDAIWATGDVGVQDLAV
jgi:hypothetical protein